MSTAALCQLCGASVRADDRFCPNCGASVQAGSPDPPAQPVGSRWDQLLDRVRAAVAPRYRVERVLGYGGMAGVYLAHETRLARRVAVKVMAPELMLDQTLVHRFRQEAQTIAQLRHPNIVAVHNIDENDGLNFFVMEYVPGRTLARVVASEGAEIPIRAILHWLAQVGSALDYGHRQGIVHRDVKPGNVLLSAEGDALVTDFGIAKASDMPGLTRTGMLVGTPAYVSPEYCLSGAVSGASDQYSLGILAFEMLTGRPPFTGPTLATLQAHISQPPPSLAGLRSDCPARVSEAIERMLAKTPEERFPDVRGALAAMGAEPLSPDDPLRPEIASLSRAVEDVAIGEAPGPLRVGESLRIEAQALGAEGDPLTGRPIHLSSSDPDVAIILDSGAIQATGPGGTTITAECEGARAEVAVLVMPQPADEIELDPIPGPVPSGTSVRMNARLPGSQASLTGPISWSTSDPNVAVITGDGWIEARNPGITVIVASVGDQSAAALLTVEAPPAAAPPAAAPSSEAPFVPPPAAPATEADRTRGPASSPASGSASGSVPGGASDSLPDSSAISAAAARPAVAESRAGSGEAAGSRARFSAGLRVFVVIAIVAAAGGIFAVFGGNDAGSETNTAVEGQSGGGPAAGSPLASGASTDARSDADEAASPTAPTGAASGTGVSDVSNAATGEIRIEGRLPAGSTVTATGADGVSHQIGSGASLAPGVYALEAAAEGYRPARSQLTVRAGAVATWAPTLVSDAPAASPRNSAPVTTQEAAAPPTDAPTPPTASVDSIANTPAPAENAAAAVREVIEGFVSSLETRDVDRIEGLYPDASSAWLEQWGPFLTSRDVRDVQASITDFGPLDQSADAGRVPFTILLQWTDLRNAKQQQSLNMTATLRETGGTWMITGLESAR